MHIQKHSGWMMEWTSYLHNAVGLFFYWTPLKGIVTAGVWNTVDQAYDRSSAFWFLMFGFMMWILGKMMRWSTMEKKIPLPPFVGHYLIVLSVIGVICMPVSGFWLVIPQGVYLLRKNES